ncbi:metal-dependent transcriptional regulator [uncultured Sphingobacterium sp.]|uniref:metal-dependent transcriptional regulator n=1 Tax=uncultured Sphingobacterium sp. TaxID=182688 RepID=UPI0037484396
MISYTEENYLKVLFALTQENGVATANALSKELDIKMPTVNSMMKRLADKGLVVYESYKPIRLTESGQKEAALVIRKHRLTEMYLVEKMGFGWEEVHAIAEQIEHIQSPAFFDKMDELLGYPHSDPHGSPIPDPRGTLPVTDYKKLSQCKAGEVVIFKAVHNSSVDFLKFLTEKQLTLGCEIAILEVERYDGSLTVLVNGVNKLTLSKFICDQLLVS